MVTRLCVSISSVDWLIIALLAVAIVLLLVLVFRKRGAGGGSVDLDEVQRISDRQFSQIKLINDNLEKRVSQIPTNQ